MSMHLPQIETDIENRIKSLRRNNRKQRAIIYRKFTDEYNEKCPEILDLIQKVENRQKVNHWTHVVAFAFSIALICALIDMLTKPFGNMIETPYVFIAVGGAIFLLCVILLKLNLLYDRNIDIKWGLVAGATAFILGIIGLIFSKKEVSIKDVDDRISKIEDLLKYSNPQTAKSTIKSDIQVRDLFLSDSKKAITAHGPNSISSINQSKIYDPQFLNDDYCTIYIASLLGEIFLWNSTLSSNILKNERIISPMLRVVSVENKSLRKSGINNGIIKLRGDFGSLEMREDGSYTYKLESAQGLKNFEEFVVNLSDQVGSRYSQKLFISFVGRDQIGTDSRDTIFSGLSYNVIKGNDGGDWLFGNNKVDLIDGGNGDDLIGGYDGNDQLIGGNGDDAIYGGSGSDKISGGDGNDFISGDQGDDKYLDGGDGDDVIYGGDGNDVIEGKNGNDNLIGGDGKNIIIGGFGSDVFWIMSIGKSFDTITDYSIEESDKVEISNIVPQVANANQLKNFVSGQATSSGLVILTRMSEKDKFSPVAILKNFNGNLDILLSKSLLIYKTASRGR